MFAWPEPNKRFVSATVVSKTFVSKTVVSKTVVSKTGVPAEYDKAWYFLIADNRIAVKYDHLGQWQPFSEGDSALVESVESVRHFLGYMEDVACFAIEAADVGELPFSGLRELFGKIDNMMVDLAGRAIQVCAWNRNHRFCGKCGAKTQRHERERAMVCSRCGIHAYPRLSPSIIVLIHRGEEILLARNHRFPEGMYSTLAGFVEPGESIEQTLVREVAEEVGVKVKNLQYLGSQPWPFPNSLMLGFHAEYDSGEIVVQEEEIADARWFRYDDLPDIPGSMAISRWLIEDYLAKLSDA